jgi:adenine C2-methylase RlmN of 23S rRNA A2503 and tRNA A37
MWKALIRIALSLTWASLRHTGNRPSRARQERFQSILREHGVVATLRREKGHDIAAACGQLRLQTKQAEREVRLSV